MKCSKCSGLSIYEPHLGYIGWRCMNCGKRVETCERHEVTAFDRLFYFVKEKPVAHIINAEFRKPRPCLHCGIEMSFPRKPQKFCTASCRYNFGYNFGIESPSSKERLICDYCNKVIETKRARRKYCNKDCHYNAQLKSKKIMPEKKNCLMCQKPLKSMRKTKMYCDNLCIQRYRALEIKKDKLKQAWTNKF